jgi:hypothetical protein
LVGGAKVAIQPCRSETPAASAGGAVAVAGAVAPGWVVVVVVVAGTVVVVVVVAGTVVVVVVGAGAINGILVGTVDVVVVVGGIVVVVGGVDVVVVGGSVVVVVVVVDPAGTAAVGGGVIVTVAQAPACSSVATSAMSCVRLRFSAVSSDVSANAARPSALAALPRWRSELLTSPTAALLSSIRLFAATPRYCCATTPSELWGVFRVNG